VPDIYHQLSDLNLPSLTFLESFAE